MAKFDLLKMLKERPLVCDGAMGTQLMAAGLRSGDAGELWNLQRPEAVQGIHRAYRDAGCDLLTTNTFGGTSIALARHNLESQLDDINRQGSTIARAAAGERAWVLGDIGPTGGFLEPMGDLTEEQGGAAFTRQAEALATGGCDAFIVETMSDPGEAALAIHAARDAANLPVIATYAFGLADGTFRTMMGVGISDAVHAAVEAGADVVGANCGTALSLDDYRRLAEQLVVAAGGRAVIVQSNAGTPTTIDGQLRYAATPDDMAALAHSLVQAGVKIVGGCCGTTPAHLVAMARKIKS